MVTVRHASLSLFSTALFIALFLGAILSVYAISGKNLDTTIVAGPTEKIVVAAVGDSITYAPEVLTDNRDVNSYPAQLQKKLGDTFKVSNYGFNGRTLLSTGDYPYVNEDLYTQSMDINPDIVLIMLGTNDAKPSNWNARAYEKELAEFVERYKNIESKPDVFLLTVPATYNVGSGIPSATIENEVVPIIRRVSAATNTPLIDIFYATKNRPELFSDGIHPNVDGYTLIANVVYDSMKNHYVNNQY